MTIRRCLICGAAASAPFFEIESAPALCHRLCRTQAEALGQPKGRIELVFCPSCGLIYNGEFDADLIHYDGEYENALHYSAVFRDYEQALARELTDRYDIIGKAVVEIGCGDGHFLSAMCSAGAKEGFGFDPAFNAVLEPADSNVHITAERFDADALTGADVGIICCRHVLEHIDQPAGFLESVRTALGTRSVPLYFEVPSAVFSLEGKGFWDIIYEHVAYYAPTSIRTLFERAGFEANRVEHRYSNQFLSIEAAPSGELSSPQLPDQDVLKLSESAKEFEKRFATHRTAWMQRIEDSRSRSRTMVIWGAGSKTVSFLNGLAIDPGVIGYVVDSNPRKQGCYIVGSGQQIVAPGDLKEIQPDVVFLMNPAYIDEVRSSLSTIGCDATLESMGFAER